MNIILSVSIFCCASAFDAHCASRSLAKASLHSSFPHRWTAPHSASPRHLLDHRPFTTRLQAQLSEDTAMLKGEELVPFTLESQDANKWKEFFIAVSGVLGSLFYVWLYPNGPQLGDAFVHSIESLASGDSTLTITYMLLIFAVIHSGLASLRPKGEELIGAKAWRYLFAYASLPLAFTTIVYFINHRYDGIQLWDIRLLPGVHDAVWISSLISFLFLYPSTFNLLEIAAVDKPQLHLWETGITRITRHPQMVGQLVWCAAHTAYIGKLPIYSTILFCPLKV